MIKAHTLQTRRTLLKMGAILVATACSSEGRQPHLSLQRSLSVTRPAPGPRPLRIAMSAAFVSEAGVHVYDDITKYLSTQVGQEIEFITGLGYSTINDMLSSGAVDVGFVCGLPYVMLHDRTTPAVDLLVAPVMKAERYRGQPKYFSDLIVHKSSEFQSIQQLAGRTFVFNEAISNSGYNLPRYRLVQLGLTTGFFGEVLRSGSHEVSIEMVAKGRADASFVDSLVLDYDRHYKLGYAEQVRVIESVGPAGIPPVVVSTSFPDPLRSNFRRALLKMHEDPMGHEILEKALVKRFVEVDSSNYDDIRQMQRAAEQAGFMTIR